MKIKEIHEFFSADHDNVSSVTVIVETEHETGAVAFGEGEPEDMYLFRDLIDAYDISDLLKMAYYAGKRGESLEYEFIEERDDE